MEKLFQFPDQCIDVQRQLAPFEFETATQKQKCIYMVDARDDVELEVFSVSLHPALLRSCRWSQIVPLCASLL